MAESASSSSVVASLRALLTSLLQRAWTWVVRSTTQLQDSLVSLLLDFLSLLTCGARTPSPNPAPHHRQHSVRIRGALSTELGVRSVVRCRRPQRPQLLDDGWYLPAVPRRQVPLPDHLHDAWKCKRHPVRVHRGIEHEWQSGWSCKLLPSRSMPEDPTESSLRRESVVAFCRERSTWRRCAA